MSGSDLRQRLAAILAADVAGYSRLMSLDERATVAALDAARAVFRSTIESNQGRVIDMAGDSVLAVFDTAAGIFQPGSRSGQLNDPRPDFIQMQDLGNRAFFNGRSRHSVNDR